MSPDLDPEPEATLDQLRRFFPASAQQASSEAPVSAREAGDWRWRARAVVASAQMAAAPSAWYVARRGRRCCRPLLGQGSMGSGRLMPPAHASEVRG